MKLLQNINNMFINVQEFDSWDDGYYLNYPDNCKIGLYLQKMLFVIKSKPEPANTSNGKNKKRFFIKGTT